MLTALVFTAHGHHTGSLTLSLAMLPPVVALIIMLVNGNIGAGLAVAGTFALVRFRSVPGSARRSRGCSSPSRSALPAAWATSPLRGCSS
ncbi:MAG: hypothetical protein V8S87_08955 [Oscillospiraceae bacterium]